MIYILHIFICLFNHNWVETRWHQYSTHLDTNSTQNEENGTYITIKNYIYTCIYKLCISVGRRKLYCAI
jgi:hypothetical protein